MLLDGLDGRSGVVATRANLGQQVAVLVWRERLGEAGDERQAVLEQRVAVVVEQRVQRPPVAALQSPTSQQQS